MLVHSLSFSLLLPLSFYIQSVVSQSSPGGTFFSGNGAPGAGAYRLVDDYTFSTFFNKFNFYSAGDPTNGHVQYVNRTVAERNGLIFVTNQGTVKISPDTTNVWPRGGMGRPSVRVISDNTYTHGLFVLDLLHMPWGCGTWPAYWLLGPNWPNNGEIDIIEGVNTQQLNGASLHTKTGCTVAGTDQTGTLQTTNCDSSVNGNTGCGSQFSNSSTPNNYGPGFNNNGGGVYVTEWTSKYIKTWFFSRNNVPASLTSGSPDPRTFGTPAVNHQGSCDIDKNFNNMSIIINTAFCGDWAGAVYSQFTQCPQTPRTSSKDSCVDFVGNNPSSFASAYWNIKSLRVFQMPPGAVPSSTYSTSLSSASGLATSVNTIDRGLGHSTSVSSVPYTGPLSSATTSAPIRAATPTICPTFNNSAYTNYNNEPYTIGCGFDYDGGGVGIPGDGIIQTSSFEQCLEACDRTYNCLAVAFAAADSNGQGNCYLKATVGTFVRSGSINAAIRINGKVSSISTSRQSTKTSTAAAAPTGSTPTCPDFAGRAFTDTSGVSYSIACYNEFAGSDIGTPLTFDSISACMPSCSSMSGCVGIVFDNIRKTCRLKSSFTGTQSPNNNMIAARKNPVVSSKSSSSRSSTTTSRNGPGGYGYASVPEPGYGDYGYGGYGGQVSTSSVQSASSALQRTSSTQAGQSTSQVTSDSPLSLLSPQQTATSRGVTSSSDDTPTWSSTISTASSSVSTSMLPILSSSIIESSAISSWLLSSISLASTSAFASPLPSETSISTSWTAPRISSSISPSYLSTATSTSLLLIQTSSALSTKSSSPLASSLSSSSLKQSLSTLTQTSNSASNLWSSASPAGPSATPCPNNIADYCGATPRQQTTCADTTGSVYVVSCGIIYYGKVIDTPAITARDELHSRALAVSVGDCQALCNSYSDCKAFNFVTQNCALVNRIDGNTPNADAVAGRLVVRAAVTTAASSASSQAPPIYGESGTSSTISSINRTTSLSSEASTGISITSLTPIVTTTIIPSLIPTVTVTTTATQQLPSGGVLTTGTDELYYLYPSQSSMGTNGSVTLCFDCGLTPTIITGPIRTPSVIAPSTCSARKIGTVTVYTTSTVTTCGPQPTCPASGYLIISGSTAHPSQTIITTTGISGQPITYTQIPTSPLTTTTGSVRPSSILIPAMSTYSAPAIETSEPRCPATNNTIITDSYGMQYRIHCDTIFREEILQSQTQNSLTGCIIACDLYNIRTYFRGTQCFGVSWFSNRISSNCLLKSGATGSYQPDYVSCELLTPSLYNATVTTTVYSNVPVPSPYTTVVGGSIVYSTYTTTLPASTITLYSTIFTNGLTTGTPVAYTTVPASTVTSTATVTVGGTTIVTQGPGNYGGGGAANEGGTVTVTVNGDGNGYGSGGAGIPTTVYVTRTQVSTYISNGQTIYSTYGITTIASTVYIQRTVTAVSVSILVTQSIQYVPTTIYATATQGVTATIVTSVPVTYTQVVSTGGGSEDNEDGGGVVTVTQSGAAGGTVYVTVTQVILPSSSSSSFTCRTYATNYLKRLQARAEPTSEPLKVGGVFVEPVVPGMPRYQKQSIFQKEVIMADIHRMEQGPRNLLTGEFDYFFID